MTQKMTEGLEAAWAAVGGKWKTQILYHLMDGEKRFSELKKCMPEITQRMLTNALRDLESSGIVRRCVYAEVPTRVEYRLTDIGKSMEQVIETLQTWGNTYKKWKENKEG
tara:strand:- start:1106 stop:1435 length:330 start_codon:yes stop_codon:yes gene_type:complete